MTYYNHELKIYFRNGKPTPYMALTDAEKLEIKRIEYEEKRKEEIIDDCPF